MADESGRTRLCPFCMEEISAEAIRCKHCRSFVGEQGPSHGGTCPYCKESIHPEASRCKHCGSAVAGGVGELPIARGRAGSADFRRAAPRSAEWMTATPPFEGEVIRCETSEMDFGVYKLIFEDCLYRIPFETIGPDGRLIVEYVEYWWPRGEPTIVWVEPGLKRPNVIGGRTPVFR